MKITRTCPFTGEVNTRELGVTAAQLAEYAEGRATIQNVFPTLPAEDREFIKTGITPEQWEKTFGEG